MVFFILSQTYSQWDFNILKKKNTIFFTIFNIFLIFEILIHNHV